MQAPLLAFLVSLGPVFFLSTSLHANPIQSVAKCDSSWKGVEAVDGTVTRVVDGDTVRVAVDGAEYSVRFQGIDTPEKNYQGKSQGYWADEATRRLSRLLPAGQEVTVTFDQEYPCDSFGRLLGHVWKDDESMNYRMLEEALAVNYCIYPATECREMGVITERNIRENRGIFGPKGTELPYEWRRKVSGRPHEKYVGNINTHEVYPPGSLKRVPIGERIFFMKKSDVRKPYRLVK